MHNVDIQCTGWVWFSWTALNIEMKWVEIDEYIVSINSVMILVNALNWNPHLNGRRRKASECSISKVTCPRKSRMALSGTGWFFGGNFLVSPGMSHYTNTLNLILVNGAKSYWWSALPPLHTLSPHYLYLQVLCCEACLALVTVSLALQPWEGMPCWQLGGSWHRLPIESGQFPVLIEMWDTVLFVPIERSVVNSST